jgi:Copper amine oxidase N-terminal domain.
MKKEIKGFIAGVIMTTMLTGVAFADGAYQTINVLLNSVNIAVNGQRVQADNILYNDRTYVPLAVIAAMLGKDVVWDENTNTANINDKGNTIQSGSTTQTVKAPDLSDVVTYLKNNGFEIGEVKPKAYSMMGAVDGFGLIVNNEQIELYLFDPSTASQEILKNLESARSIGKFSMSGFTFPVIMNGNIMLTRYETHPDKDKIVAAFKNFK